MASTMSAPPKIKVRPVSADKVWTKNQNVFLLYFLIVLRCFLVFLPTCMRMASSDIHVFGF